MGITRMSTILTDILELGALEKLGWDGRTAALDASGVPQNNGEGAGAGDGGPAGAAASEAGASAAAAEASIDDIAAGAKNPDAVKNAVKAERDARAQAERTARENASKLEAAQTQLQQLQDAGKSESQKLLDRISNLEKTTVESQQRADRAELARQFDLPADLITGTTRDEMTATAERLKAWGENQQQTARSASDGLDGGARPSGSSLTREQIAALSTEQYLARKDEVDKALTSLQP